MSSVELFYVKDECPSSEVYGSYEAALDDAFYFGFKTAEFSPTRIVDVASGVTLCDIFEMRRLYKQWGGHAH